MKKFFLIILTSCSNPFISIKIKLQQIIDEIREEELNDNL
jgi:hypothetical protein